MSIDLRNRSLLDLVDFSRRDLRYLIDLAAELQRSKPVGNQHQRLEGKNVALIFDQSSTRARCAVGLAVHDQGGPVTHLDSAGQPGHEESLKDTARVRGRRFDGIEYRGFHQTVVQEIAKFSHVPVWNGLTDEARPTQVLADRFKMQTLPAADVGWLAGGHPAGRRPAHHRDEAPVHPAPRLAMTARPPT